MANHEGRGGRRAPCVHPTAREIRGAQERAKLSDTQCGDLVCVSERTWFDWAWGVKPMPAGAWKLFRYEVGMLELRAFDREPVAGYSDPPDGPYVAPFKHIK